MKNAITLRGIRRFSALALMTLAGAAQAIPERPASGPVELLARLNSNTQGALLNHSLPDSLYNTVHSTGKTPLLVDNPAADPVERAQFFLSIYGSLVGADNPLNQLGSRRVSKDRTGVTHVHMDQVSQGLPVFGARLVVHMDGRGVRGVNGVFVPGLDQLSTTPKMSIGDLRQRAMAAGAKMYPGKALKLESSRLMFYRTGLLKGVPGESYLAYEVILTGGTLAYPIKDRLILDANRGTVLNRIDEIHTVLNREIYFANQDIPPVYTEGSVGAPSDIPLVGDVGSDPTSRIPRLPIDNLYIFAGGTYELYKNLFGREGYDDGFIDPATGELRAQVQKSVYLINEQCPNAYWNGDSTNYCPAFDADDVVSHEWSHAYTEYTHGLVYQYQSGALNEAYSDIFGETYDLVNGIEGPLGVTLTEGDYFENGGSRWVVGEDLSEAAAGLLLRDMWDPDNFGINVPLLGIQILATPSPGSVITSENYYCSTGDNGGVHTNSGVPNHMYAMLVDGKEFNGVTIPKIGMTKAAHIYFQAETQYQTPTTNFAQHADALLMSCKDLIGQPLNDVLGKVSSEVIEAKDCDAVELASKAVELRQNPKEKCGYTTVLKPEASTPALCPTGKFVTPSFKETWESGAIPSGWTISKNITGDYDSPSFTYTVVSDLPAPHSGKALFANNDGDGTCAAGGDASGSIRADSPEFTVPDSASFLSFTHFMQSEQGFDGGNLKYSTDGGSTYTIVPQDAFTYNEHTGVFGDGPLLPIPDPIGLPGNGNNTSPLAGEAAWTGADQGEATGSWGTTVVDLAKLGLAKDAKVKFRWEFGQDGCGGNLGWFIDDTQVYYCGLTDPGTGSSSGGSSSGGSSGGSSSSGGSTSSGSSSGGSTSSGSSSGSSGGSSSGSSGRFGGGAFGWLALLPLFAAALRRRRSH